VKRLILAALVALGLAWAAPAAADPEASARVRVRGSGAKAVERAVGKVLAAQGIQVVKGQRAPAALRVDGRVRARSGGGKGVTVELRVRRGEDVIANLTVRGASARAAARKIERELGPAIEPALASAREPPAAEPPPKPRPKPRRRRVARRASPAPQASIEVAATPPEPEMEMESSHQTWLSFAVGPELYGRHFSYRDDIFEALNEYDLSGTPALTAAGEVYPMANRSRGIVAHLGGAASFTHVPEFDSEDLAGGQYTSKARSYALGARYRHRLFGIDLAAALDYGSQSFSIKPIGEGMQPDFPAVRYNYLRAGLSATAPVWSRLAASGAIGYRQVLSSGEIESDDFFPRASARGLDLQLELSTSLRWRLDLRAGATLERYGHALNPEPGDTHIAGGALDQYLRFYVRLGFTR
jgi:hypothetical protein